MIAGLAGCGRFGFDSVALNVSGDSGNGDGGADAFAETACWNAWKAGAPIVSPPQLITQLGTTVPTFDPSVSADALTLYYADTSNNADLWLATRATRASVWAPVGRITELDTSGAESKLTVTADGLVGVWAYKSFGGTDADLWMATRTDVQQPWGSIGKTLLANVDTALDDFDPHLTPDGLDLYYAPNTAGGQVIVHASRPTRADAFTIDRTLTELAQPNTYSDPSVSPDQLVIAYAGTGPGVLYFATRTTTASPFGTPAAIPAVGGAGRQTDVELSLDGCELYFSSTRTGAKAVYVSTVSP